MSSNRYSSSDEEHERSPSRTSQSKSSQGSVYRKNISSQSHKEELEHHNERRHRRWSGSGKRIDRKRDRWDRSRSKNSGYKSRRSRSRSPRRYRDRSGDRKDLKNKSSEGHDQGGTSNLPNFLNPLSGNSARYAEQLAKRKMLWNNKKSKEEDTSKKQSIWEGAKFSQDQDGKLTAKFQRLMGMKETQKTDKQSDGKVKDLFKKQEELFSSMEMQYEVARATTHTQRGVGLGFGPRHIP